jgi:hypothetical protein
MTNGLLVITFPGHGPVAGLVVKAGRIDRAPPIAAYVRGWPEVGTRAYFLARACSVSIIPDEAEGTDGIVARVGPARPG